MSSKKNMHRIFETSRDTWVVSSWRDEGGVRSLIVDDFTTRDLEQARNVAQCRSLDFGGTWGDAPGYELDSESGSRVGQSDSPTPPNTEEKRMNEELNELKAQVKELQSKVDGLVTTNYAREERFHDMSRQVHEYTSGKPTDRFMRSVIS